MQPTFDSVLAAANSLMFDLGALMVFVPLMLFLGAIVSQGRRPFITPVIAIFDKISEKLGLGCIGTIVVLLFLLFCGWMLMAMSSGIAQGYPPFVQ